MVGEGEVLAFVTVLLLESGGYMYITRVNTVLVWVFFLYGRVNHLHRTRNKEKDTI